MQVFVYLVQVFTPITCAYERMKNRVAIHNATKHRSGDLATSTNPLPVLMERWSHPFPFRTRKLSISSPRILVWRRTGKVGQCRSIKEKPLRKLGFF